LTFQLTKIPLCPSFRDRSGLHHILRSHLPGRCQHQCPKIGDGGLSHHGWT